MSTTWISVDSFTTHPSEGDELVVEIEQSPGRVVATAEVVTVGRHYSRPGQSGYRVEVDTSGLPDGHVSCPRNQTTPLDQRSGVRSGWVGVAA